MFFRTFDLNALDSLDVQLLQQSLSFFFGRIDPKWPFLHLHCGLGHAFGIRLIWADSLASKVEKKHVGFIQFQVLCVSMDLFLFFLFWICATLQV